MATKRVYELAKDMNMSSKALLTKLKELGLDVKNHMSTIPSAEVERIKTMVFKLDKKEPVSEPKKQTVHPTKTITSNNQVKQNRKIDESNHKLAEHDHKSITDKKATPKSSQDEQSYERGGKQKIKKNNRFEDKKPDYKK